MEDKYSNQCYKSNSQTDSDSSLFVERRGFRRFNLSASVKLVGNGGLCFAKPVNLSSFGLLCRTVNNFEIGTKLRIHLASGAEEGTAVTALGMVDRVIFDREVNAYEIFIRFQDNIDKDLRGVLS